MHRRPARARPRAGRGDRRRGAARRGRASRAAPTSSCSATSPPSCRRSPRRSAARRGRSSRSWAACRARTWWPPTPTARCTACCPARRSRCARASCSWPAASRRPLDDAVVELFGELGLLVPLEEELLDVGMGLMSTAPAYYALVAEAQVDAGVRHGLPADRAAQLVVQTMAGTAALLAPPRPRHAGRAPRGHLARAARPPAGSTRWSARASAPPSPTRWTPCAGRERGADERPRARGLPRRPGRLRPSRGARLHAADHRLHPQLALLRLRRARALRALVERDPGLPARRRASRTWRSSGASSRRSARWT